MIGFCSCRSLDGKIEIRRNSIYLVNSSTKIEFKFTVKQTEIKNDSTHSYSTRLIQLALGDEELLGNDTFKSKILYPTLYENVFQSYDSKDYSDDPKIYQYSKKSGWKKTTILDFAPYIPNLPDTVINERKLKYEFITQEYPDTKHPFPVDHFKNKYEVTGQIEIKSKE